MFNTFRTVMLGGALALAPIAASAATLIEDGNTYTIGYTEAEFIGDVEASGGAGSFTVTFEADVDPVTANAAATIGNINLAQFSDLTISWLDDSMNVLSSAAITVGSTDLSTVFTAPNLTQVLQITWSDSTDIGNFDIEVAATVPLPAGGLLLLTALGGGAALRRKKKSA
ncbi:MAG: VPLPA-CTERM sorting domain-containing protein [Rhodobacteraceae bacterium]|nr:VPLPA-CTERM sorting domain-containing protein [Paracoccaceae bacterium]